MKGAFRTKYVLNDPFMTSGGVAKAEFPRLSRVKGSFTRNRCGVWVFRDR